MPQNARHRRQEVKGGSSGVGAPGPTLQERDESTGERHYGDPSGLQNHMRYARVQISSVYCRMAAQWSIPSAH